MSISFCALDDELTSRDISVPLSDTYCMHHARSKADGLLPLLVCLPGTVFWTLSATQTPPTTEAASTHLLKTFLFARY